MTYELAENDLDRFIGVPEAAARLGIHVGTAQRWIRDNRFPVPVQNLGAKRVVSLRLLVEFIHAR